MPSHEDQTFRSLQPPTQILRRWLPAGLWMGLIFYLSAQPDLPLPSETPDLVSYLAHVGEYAVLAGLLLWAAGPRPRRRAFALAALLALAYALSDEWHQSFVPGRSCSLADLAADAAGAACALALLARTRLLHRPPPPPGPEA